jgi:ribA/ribD-fused uncharacterized protein
MTDSITAFQGEYRFLSNFWPAPIEFAGIDWPSVEHAYQAMKSTNRAERVGISRLDSPGAAKRAGRKVKFKKADWEKEKFSTMDALVQLKFKIPELAQMLKETGDAELVEGNTWSDRYWGQSPIGTGENNLGKILMAIRDRL